MSVRGRRPFSFWLKSTVEPARTSWLPDRESASACHGNRKARHSSQQILRQAALFVTMSSMAFYEVIESISEISLQYSFILWKHIDKNKLSIMTSMSRSSKEPTKLRLIHTPLFIASLFVAPNEQGRRNVGLANYHLKKRVVSNSAAGSFARPILT